MNLKNLVWISALLTSCALSIYAQEQSFEQSLDHLWAEYKKKSELLNTNVQQLSFTSKEDLDRVSTEFGKLIQSLDHVIAYAIEKGEYKGSLKIILDEHKAALEKDLQNQLSALAHYTMHRSRQVTNLAERLKSLKTDEWFCKWMQKIGGTAVLASASYFTIAPYFNITLPQLDDLAFCSFVAGTVSFFFFNLWHCGNLDAQANVRNYIREHNLDKAKELEGWEKDIGKTWNLDTNV